MAIELLEQLIVALTNDGEELCYQVGCYQPTPDGEIHRHSPECRDARAAVRKAMATYNLIPFGWPAPMVAKVIAALEPQP